MNRALDLAGAGIAAVVLAPVIAATAVFVRCTMGAPVLFRQERTGLHGRPFTFVKFRTMRPPAAPGFDPGSDAGRLTPAGRFLRATSLDELPALWNVLRGDMSLVGPRPLPSAYLGRYTEREAHRHDVRPGITGLAQVLGRNNLTWEQKFAHDLHYVRHRTLRMDLRILATTVRTVLRRDGVTAIGSATNHELRAPTAGRQT
ncbi:sugar transferase [Dactylosporangium aurantiacum]|uniref:Sugar transferase n=1 Tax=Dactylosporangium aurantiacum TaxID=35754 RepID=A0A9Q9ILI9_9ACTN|nr:sugar transferase [Dactylosporangium aurantiacum]MDG6100829.1 sugar transferase [Dactylosporangium aurantiacum]UWZ55110.1 sugar transferase [Dactylosporangium aurantiacum]